MNAKIALQYEGEDIYLLNRKGICQMQKANVSSHILLGAAAASAPSLAFINRLNNFPIPLPSIFMKLAYYVFTQDQGLGRWAQLSCFIEQQKKCSEFKLHHHANITVN